MCGWVLSAWYIYTHFTKISFKLSFWFPVDSSLQDALMALYSLQALWRCTHVFYWPIEYRGNHNVPLQGLRYWVLKRLWLLWHLKGRTMKDPNSGHLTKLLPNFRATGIKSCALYIKPPHSFSILLHSNIWLFPHYINDCKSLAMWGNLGGNTQSFWFHEPDVAYSIHVKREGHFKLFVSWVPFLRIMFFHNEIRSPGKIWP